MAVFETLREILMVIVDLTSKKQVISTYNEHTCRLSLHTKSLGTDREGSG